jgi:hypothetical protein
MFTKEQHSKGGVIAGKLIKDKLWVTNMKTNQLRRIHRNKIKYFLKKNKEWQQGHFLNAFEISL